MSKISVQHIPNRSLSFLLVCASVFMTACNSGLIKRVEVDPATHMTCDSTFNTPCGVLDTQPVTVLVWGQGQCDSVALDSGAGATYYVSPVDFGKTGASVPAKFTFNYSYAWPGLKTLHAYPASNCMGEARQTIQVMRKIGNTARSDLNFTLAQPYSFANGITPGPCKLAFDLHHVTALRPNTKVTVSSRQDPNSRINFGCAFGGCIYGVDGEAGSSASAPLPFPGMAKYSLVLKIGSQLVQGGSQVSFTTNNKAALELCVNDDNLRDNTGEWNFTISVDETQAN